MLHSAFRMLIDLARRLGKACTGCGRRGWLRGVAPSTFGCGSGVWWLKWMACSTRIPRITARKRKRSGWWIHGRKQLLFASGGMWRGCM
ncbi:hypothetical protein CHLRE_06g310276v5 [Chlamydomonas reinhardtii]|uniref:Uncharacterized protein n=1 Tax=Chlamydomonas reinhardtii TaxID=3055 RepID=A0A2K3DRK3_CHLRE|nr:uncharacterized protein CHLRE_06g310276v5 [Chlamydomonas reinhardtii]PNW83185.1 hypothetical protein CHLRE_06g310276v5 [Chlamydomonas reinhardtii]